MTPPPHRKDWCILVLCAAYNCLSTDINLNGQIKYAGADNDRDPILVNIGGSQVTKVRVEQLPAP